jgi:hypothetical protein
MVRQILGIIIIGIIIYYYFLYKENKLEKSYKDVIYPKISNELNKDEHKKLTVFLFKIQLFYDYNPPAFEEMKQHIEDFIILYKGANVNYKYAGVFYDLMIDKKSLILNNLRSISIKLPIEYTPYQSLDDLELILNEYLDKVYELNNEYIYDTGINRYTKILNSKNLAHNRFTEDYGSFALY